MGSWLKLRGKVTDLIQTFFFNFMRYFLAQSLNLDFEKENPLPGCFFTHFNFICLNLSMNLTHRQESSVYSHKIWKLLAREYFFVGKKLQRGVIIFPQIFKFI